MIKVEAATLQEAYSKAASELSCSVVDLEINIIQNGSSGFLGLFKKSAIIEVQRKGSKPFREERERKEFVAPPRKEESREVETALSDDDQRRDRNRRPKNRRNKNKNREFPKSEFSEPKRSEPLPPKETPSVATPKAEPKVEMPKAMPVKEPRHTIAPTAIDQNFHHEKRELNDVIDKVRVQIKNLFKYSCFTLESPSVSKYNDDTILIEFSGEDAALLIGKEGYRYKALSYLLYNWINLKYGLNIRLEIAEFLKNQEEMIEKYLIPVIERIRNSGKGQTKILDGVLIKIALEALRGEFPEKYVGIKSGKDGGKFIVVNDFNRKNA
ncbi:Jag N-terminal domain-containing protein [Sulfurospirillum multivorans]|uniref:RNA-binding domain-containing protein n=2 Tax=Sulfurospirillum multivorans TaxID=66821 RepID=A0AA86E035_SULMK|nr:Jag N-terminal domain-containing protein [Sulfurospirillum multivorans]AHJ13230.1 RNA-binding domain-containing protein [Sulfurospirillum multivorans DSM 12446]QEH06718.1 RNA-binding domain-containing protein [Sulfurospirillum multivorans]